MFTVDVVAGPKSADLFVSAASATSVPTITGAAAN
jgi:hypothetical protein